MSAQHCDSSDCQEKDKFGYCHCKCEACMKRKEFEGEWAENEWKARAEEQIGEDEKVA